MIHLLAKAFGGTKRYAQAETLIKTVGINQLDYVSIEDIRMYTDCTIEEATRVHAFIDYGSRCRTAREPVVSHDRAHSIAQLFMPQLQNLDHEQMWVVVFNNQHNLLHKFMLSKGAVNSTVVDGKLLFRNIIKVPCAVSFAIAHNHPSNACYPSPADIAITKKIQTAAKCLDLIFLDHLIITKNNYYSFAEEDMLEDKR